MCRGEDFIAECGLYDPVMVILYDSACCISACVSHYGLYIEFMVGFCQGDSNGLLLDHFFCPFYAGFIQIMQDFKSVARLSAYCSQSRGDVKADHSRARDPYTHAVLQDVAADFHADCICSGHPPV